MSSKIKSRGSSGSLQSTNRLITTHLLKEAHQTFVTLHRSHLFNSIDQCHTSADANNLHLESEVTVLGHHYHMHNDGTLFELNSFCDCPDVHKINNKDFIKITASGGIYFISVALAVQQSDVFSSLFIGNPPTTHHPVKEIKSNVKMWREDYSSIGSRTLLLEKTSKRAGEAFALSISSSTFLPPDDVIGEVFSLAKQYQTQHIVHRILRRSMLSPLLPLALLRTALVCSLSKDLAFLERAVEGTMLLMAHLDEDKVNQLDYWEIMNWESGEKEQEIKESSREHSVLEGYPSLEIRQRQHRLIHKYPQIVRLHKNIRRNSVLQIHSLYLKDEFSFSVNVLRRNLQRLYETLEYHRKELISENYSIKKMQQCILYHYNWKVKRQNHAIHTRNAIHPIPVETTTGRGCHPKHLKEPASGLYITPIRSESGFNRCTQQRSFANTKRYHRLFRMDAKDSVDCTFGEWYALKELQGLQDNAASPRTDKSDCWRQVKEQLMS